MNEKDLIDLVKVLTVETFEADEEVITFGEQGDKFYIILMGSVSVLIPNQKIRSWRTMRFQFLQNLKWK